MAIYRNIHISFWQDLFIMSLTPEEKFFYLYLMTNSKTKQCGCYELPKKIIEFETGYNPETVEKLLNRFIEYGRVQYDEIASEILIENWLKYNISKSPKVLSCIRKELLEIKNPNFAEQIKVKIDTLLIKSDIVSKSFDTVSKSKHTLSKSKHTLSKSKNTVSKSFDTVCKSKGEEEEEEKEEEQEQEKELLRTSGKKDFPVDDKKENFIDSLFHLFKEIYLANRGFKFIETNYKKEFTCIAKLLKIYKELNQDSNTYDCTLHFDSFFKQCMEITDPFIYENLSPSIILLKINTIQTLLKKPNTKSRGFDLQKLSKSRENLINDLKGDNNDKRNN